MKHPLFILILYFCIPLKIFSQEAIIYYEGFHLYCVKQEVYEFQSLISHVAHSNYICCIKDSLFLNFLDKKTETVEKCAQTKDCCEATIKPNAMIQVVYIKDKYNYYTINTSAFLDEEYLTIDGKSYVPDAELQEVLAEIVKYNFLNKYSPSTTQLKAFINGERTIRNSDWQILP